MSEHVRVLNADQEVPPYISMSCLLVREGANWQTASMLGVDVMALCPPEMTPVIHQVARQSRRYLSPPLSTPPKLICILIESFCCM